MRAPYPCNFAVRIGIKRFREWRYPRQFLGSVFWWAQLRGQAPPGDLENHGGKELTQTIDGFAALTRNRKSTVESCEPKFTQTGGRRGTGRLEVELPSASHSAENLSICDWRASCDAKFRRSVDLCDLSFLFLAGGIEGRWGAGRLSKLLVFIVSFPFLSFPFLAFPGKAENTEP